MNETRDDDDDDDDDDSSSSSSKEEEEKFMPVSEREGERERTKRQAEKGDLEFS
jgi:hypothetical protein